jgi:competence protein ComEC
VLHAAARVQIAVTLALIPATVVLFHQLSIVSPLANAVAIPIVSWAVTPLALLGAALAMLPAPVSLLADPMLSTANAVFAIVATILQWAASFVWANVPVATPPLLLIALAAIGVIWLLAPPGWPLRAMGAVAILPMFVWPATRADESEVWVTALDVGQGSALLVETKDQAWLYDAGPRYSADTDAGERLILPYLRHRGIGRLSGLIVSHLDSDHSGGAASILRAIAADRVISSIAPKHPMLGARTDVERCVAGMQWSSGPLTFAVLHPAPVDYDAKRTSNAMSCVVLITSGVTRLLLTGDVQLADESALLTRTPALRVDWLAVPHHGSRNSSGALLLDTLGTTSAVAQAGYRNRFRHPDPDVVARYHARNIRFFRTDHAGALQWRFIRNGSNTVFSTRESEERYWHNRPGTVASRTGSGTATPEVDTGAADAIPGPPEPYVGR